MPPPPDENLGFLVTSKRRTGSAPVVGSSWGSARRPASDSVTTGGPGFGSQHFKTLDFLRDHEVVLTFDDGPWLNTTKAVLKALADQCLRATFFTIGKHATYYPEILKEDIAAGHTVGSHTWSLGTMWTTLKPLAFS